jgi:hypothetical protein
MVRVRQLAVDEHFSLRGKALEECIRADKEKGLIPFLVCCSFLFFFNDEIFYFYIRFRVR